MLKLTRKTEYALIALAHIENVTPEAVSSTKEISEQYHIPKPLLAKIMQTLAKHGILEPVQGPKGGYKLQKKLDNVSMTKFFEILEGPLGIMDCYFDSTCEQLDICNIQTPIKKINEKVRNMFDNISVHDITH